MDNNPYESVLQDGKENPYEVALPNKIPKTENFLQKVINNSQAFQRGFMDTNYLGLPRIVESGANALVRKISPGPETEQAISQADKMSYPEGTGTAYATGAAIPITHAVYKLGELGIDALFGKQLAKNALPKASSKLTSSIQDVIAKSKADPVNLGVPKAEVLKRLEDQFSKANVPYGKQAVIFKRWINALKTPGKLPDMLTGDVISEMETDFGNAAGFGKEASKPALKQAAIETRRYVSAKMDEMASKAGVPEFITRSADKSRLLSKMKAKPGTFQKLARKGIEGLAAGAGGYGGYKIIKSLSD